MDHPNTLGAQAQPTLQWRQLAHAQHPSTDSQIQTFLSFSEPSVRRTPLACMCRYRTRCSADMSHLITYSTCQDPTGSHTQPSGKPPTPRGIKPNNCSNHPSNSCGAG